MNRNGPKQDAAAGQKVSAASLTPTVITPGGGWQALNLAELWRFRELLYFLIWRDVKVRYKQTVLGAAWALIQPAMMTFALWFGLGKMAKVPGADDPLFIYSGILPWTFFATALASAGNSVVNSERLVTKVYFPRLAVPLAAVGAAVVDFMIASVLLVAMMLMRGVVPGVGLAVVPLVFVLLGVAAAGVGVLLSALMVAYRDFRYVVPFLVQFWLFATLTVYTPLSRLELSPWILSLNPMCGLIASFRAGLLNEPIPWALLGTSAASFVLLFVIGCFYFRRVEDSFADIV
ncbi:ABC transporter permease [Fontivita pretiosa]|uniref:ABC transporter permease n=1 Tax=Fontivita pretiosa TaxID=2989684 RepID=UPI003D17F982